MPHPDVVSVDVLSVNVDLEALRADLSVFGEAVDVEQSASEPQMFLEPFLPAIITIKMAWTVAAPYLVPAGALLWAAIQKEVAAVAVKGAKQAFLKAFRKGKASGFTWRSKNKDVDGPPLRAEFTLPALPGVEGRKFIVIFPNKLADEDVEKGLAALGEAVRLAEAKRQQGIDIAKQIAELTEQGKDVEASEMYILSRETIRDWTFVYDAADGWVEANLLISREANRR